MVTEINEFYTYRFKGVACVINGFDEESRDPFEDEIPFCHLVGNYTPMSLEQVEDKVAEIIDSGLKEDNEDYYFSHYCWAKKRKVV